MRSREAWLAAMAAVLGVSDVACKKDATDAPAAVREVPSVVASASAPIASASETPTASASASPSVMASTSASAQPPKLAGTGTAWQRHAPASCGAIPIGHGDPINASCGASREVKGPRAVVTATVTGAASGDERIVVMTRARLRSCANRGLAMDPTETGKAVVTVAVGANGDVTSSSVTSSTGLGAQTVACMARALQIATFPAGAARSLVVTIVSKIEDR